MRVIFYFVTLVTASRRGSQSARQAWAWSWKKDTCVFTSLSLLSLYEKGY
nr:hypothetical protein [Campylobacter troglodytis]